MTTGESIDNVDMENVTVTSDVAYERVTSDEHFVDEGEKTFLKQNTAGLVQEIPNIAFLDTADTMLEPTEEVEEVWDEDEQDYVDVIKKIGSKTLYNKANWILRVGKAAKSIEAQPQDTISFRTDEDYTYIISPGYTDNYIEFDSVGSSSNYTVCKPYKGNQGGLANIYTCKILQDGIYTVSYGWTLEPNSATWFKVIVGKLGTESGIIAQDYFKDSLGDIMSGGKHTSNISLKRGDYVYMKVQADDALKVYADTYMDIQFQQYKL